MNNKLLGIVIITMLTLSLSSRGQTATIYRSGIAISPVYATIKTAVAATLPGDSLVLNGTFNEYGISINKDLSITGDGTAVIDAFPPDFSYTRPALMISNAAYATSTITLYLKDITIQGARLYTTYKRGGAIYADTGVRIILDGTTTLKDNNSISTPTYIGGTLGGAIYCRGDVVLKDRSLIYNNKIDAAGGGIYATGNVTLMDYAECSNNTAPGTGGGGIYCGGQLTIRDHAVVSGNTSRNGGGIYTEGKLVLRDSAAIIHNVTYSDGAGIYCRNTTEVTAHARIDSNQASGNGGGIFSTGPLLLTDSSLVSGNTADASGGGIYQKQAAMHMQHTALVVNNSSRNTGAGIFINNGTFSLSDSAVVALNRCNSSYGAGIYSKASHMVISGGQIIGNRSIYDSVRGEGMALYIDSAAGFLPLVRISNARIFNPNGDTVQQNEVFNQHTGLSFYSDSTWWGDSDTAGVFNNMADTGFYLDSWVIATWSINSGLPISLSSTFPVEAGFTLNTTAALPAYMFWMLAGRFDASAGSFSPVLSWMTPANMISSMYTVPLSSGTITVSGIVDADSFNFTSAVTGLGIVHTAAAPAFRIYPNPSDGVVYIDGAELAQVTMYDLSGRLILQCNPQSKHIEIKALPGTYLLELQELHGHRQRQRVIIK